MPNDDADTPPPRTQDWLRKVREYQPFLVIGLVLALLVVLVPQPATPDRQGFGDFERRGASDLDVNDDAPTGDAPGATDAPDPDPGDPDGPDGPDAGTPGRTSVASPEDGPDAQAQSPAEPTTDFDCARERRVEHWYTYRPPICRWDGGPNPGATWKGVDEETIRIAVYLWAEDNPELAAASFAGTGTGDDDTMFHEYQVLNRWFAAQPFYETYGRQVELLRLECDGRHDDDAAMRACAVKADEELGAFGVLWEPGSEAMADELASRGLLDISPLTRDDREVDTWSPHYWHTYPRGRWASTSLAEWTGMRIAGGNSKWAGDPLIQQEQRDFGVVMLGDEGDPGTEWFKRELDRYGVPVAKFINYELDVPRAQIMATNMITQMREAGVTTVMCLCDPLFPSFLTSEASRQEYYPEWIPFGFLLDTDEFARLYDQDQMENAYAISPLGVPVPYEQTEWWRAWKEVEPDEDPNVSASAFFSLLTQLYTGVHLAGPELTPGTFAEGMFHFPPTGGTPTAPQISYGPKEVGTRTFLDHGSIDDYNQIWWDRTAESATGDEGSWRHVNGGERRMGGVGAWPSTEPPMFREEGAPSYYDDGEPAS